jgi:hypothetical protein
MTGDTWFVADTMIGKLTKWLRVPGYDVGDNAESTDAQFLRTAEADDRILLTPDHNLITCHRSLLRLYIECVCYTNNLQTLCTMRPPILGGTHHDNMSWQLQVMLRGLFPTSSELLPRRSYRWLGWQAFLASTVVLILEHYIAGSL